MKDYIFFNFWIFGFAPNIFFYCFVKNYIKTIKMYRYFGLQLFKLLKFCLKLKIKNISFFKSNTSLFQKIYFHSQYWQNAYIIIIFNIFFIIIFIKKFYEKVLFIFLFCFSSILQSVKKKAEHSYNTNYCREMKFIPINIDYCLPLFVALKLF